MKQFRAYWMIACSIAALGCGSSGGIGRPVSEFPSREALEEFADEGVNPLPPGATIELNEWQMQAPTQPVDPVNHSLGELLAKKVSQAERAKLSSELSCAAREAARIYAGHEALPDFALQNYLVLRCGATLAGVQTGVVFRENLAAESDDQAQAALHGLTQELIDEALEQPRTAIGIGFARGEARSAIVVAHGVQSAEVKDFAPLMTGSEVKISGRLLEPAEGIVGAINAGQYGVKLCEPDRSVKLPNFTLTCPVSAEDEQAAVSIMVGKKGRVLMSTVVRALFRRSDEVGLNYRPTSFGKVTQANDDKHFMSSLHDALNEARALANLPPVRLEVNQSKTNRRVVGQYFKEALGGDEGNADLIALGVLAGWNVNGAIKGGGVLPGLVPTTKNPARYLGQILDDPTGRWVLFEPTAQSVAIGARVLKPSGLVALVTTYSFFGSHNHRADEEAVFEQLSKVRVQNGLTAPVRVRAAEVQQALAQVATSVSTTEEALNEAMENVVASAQRGVSGYVMETNDLSYITFPEQFLQPGRLEIALGVTHYKPPGAAWAQYALLFVVLMQDDAGRNTARVVPTRRGHGQAAF